MEDLSELAPLVQILDLPVPQTVDYVAQALRLLDRPIAEQVIEVPTVSCSSCPSRSRVPEPQSADQLVEVPTVLTPTRIALQIAEQIVDTPVPRGHVHGSLPRQSSAMSLPESIEWVGAQRRQRQALLLEPSHSSDRSEGSAWRPGCLGWSE